MRSATIATAAYLVATGCAAPGAPIPVRGTIASLTGQWSGEYSSARSGRIGSIVFTLDAGRDTAYGDVIMIPSRLGEAAGDAEGVHRHAGTDTAFRSRLLTVAFVLVEPGEVAGRLDPYRDPACGCLLVTTFRGTLSGDEIAGTYRSVHSETGEVVEGRWRVTRRGPARSAGSPFPAPG